MEQHTPVFHLMNGKFKHDRELNLWVVTSDAAIAKGSESLSLLRGDLIANNGDVIRKGSRIANIALRQDTPRPCDTRYPHVMTNPKYTVWEHNPGGSVVGETNNLRIALQWSNSQARRGFRGAITRHITDAEGIPMRQSYDNGSWC